MKGSTAAMPPEMEKRENLWRLRGLGSELGGALGSQGGGECSGLLNLARGGPSTVNFREGDVGFLRPWTAKSSGVVHAGAQREEEASPGRPRRLATQASKQLRACTRIRGAARAAAALDRGAVIHIGSL